MTCRRFPFRTRDTDESQVPVSFEQPRACARVGPIDIIYHCIGEIRRKGGLLFVSSLQHDILRSPPDRVCRGHIEPRRTQFEENIALRDLTPLEANGQNVRFAASTEDLRTLQELAPWLHRCPNFMSIC